MWHDHVTFTEIHSPTNTQCFGSRNQTQELANVGKHYPIKLRSQPIFISSKHLGDTTMCFMKSKGPREPSHASHSFAFLNFYVSTTDETIPLKQENDYNNLIWKNNHFVTVYFKRKGLKILCT